MVYRIYAGKTICRRGCIAFIGYTPTVYDRLAEELRIFNRYDVENISEELSAVKRPFSQSRSLTTPTLACLRPTPRYLQLNICRVSLTRGRTPVLSVFR